MTYSELRHNLSDVNLLSKIGRRLVLSYQALALIASILDFAVVFVAAELSSLGYSVLFHEAAAEPEIVAGIGFASSFIYVLVARSFGLYGIPALLSPSRHVSQIVCAWTVALSLMFAFIVLFKLGASLPRGSIICFAGVSFAFLSLDRLVFGNFVRSRVVRNEIHGRPAIVIGEESELRHYTTSALLLKFGIAERGRFHISCDQGDSDVLTETQLRQISDIIAYANKAGAADIILSMRWSNSRIPLIMQQLRFSPLPVRLLPDKIVRSVTGRSAMGPSSWSLVEMQSAPLSLSQRVGKRILDVVLASAAFLILLPVFIGVGCAVKLDSPGPMIFRQRRNGFGTRPFVIFKFRTMRVMEDGPVVSQAQRHDPRVTRVGRFLRRTSIDELPQLLNVIRGDMSLVGPRPHALAHDDIYTSLISNYSFRHHVKPGISGWAQVNGFRGETSELEQMSKRIDLDIWYVNNCSFLLEIKILFMTCFEVLRSRAY